MLLLVQKEVILSSIHLGLYQHENTMDFQGLLSLQKGQVPTLTFMYFNLQQFIKEIITQLCLLLILKYIVCHLHVSIKERCVSILWVSLCSGPFI